MIEKQFQINYFSCKYFMCLFNFFLKLSEFKFEKKVNCISEEKKYLYVCSLSFIRTTKTANYNAFQ